MTFRHFLFTVLCATASAITTAQETQTITLPVSLTGKTTWEAIETTVPLNSEEEEQPAYELQGFKSISSIQHKGTVYYVPSALDDRIILLLKNVHIGGERRPALIDNPSEKQLIIHLQGRTHLSNLAGAVIRSQGPVSLYGEEKDSLDFDNVVTLYSAGQQNRSAIEAVGDVTLQNLDIDMSGNRGLYGIRAMGNGKEECVLVLNHVKGKMRGQKEAVTGFDIVEGTRNELEGVKVTLSDEGEAEEATEEPVGQEAPNQVGGDMTLPFRIMGQERFDLPLPAETVTVMRQPMRGLLLPIKTTQGRIFWVEDNRSFYFDNVSLTTNDDTPIVESTGLPLVVQFNGTNELICKGPAFACNGPLAMSGAGARDKLTIVSPQEPLQLKNQQDLTIHRLTYTPQKPKVGSK